MSVNIWDSSYEEKAQLNKCDLSSGVTRIFTQGGTTNMFTKAVIRHRNAYIKKYDKLAHLITHKMAW